MFDALYRQLERGLAIAGGGERLFYCRDLAVQLHLVDFPKQFSHLWAWFISRFEKMTPHKQRRGWPMLDSQSACAFDEPAFGDG